MSKSEDLHGSAPDTSPIAVLLIDVINDCEFDGGAALIRYAKPAAVRIAALTAQARQLAIPVIYANDNFGRWRSDFKQVLRHCLREGVRGRALAERLRPDKSDYFVLKPKRSAFFSTTLDLLLEYLKTKRLVVTGFAGDMCVLSTVADAYLRDLAINIPADCVASQSPAQNRRALQYARYAFGADIRPSTKLDLAAVLRHEIAIAQPASAADDK